MITVPAHRVKQFGVEFFQASFSAKDIDRLVKFEVLGYGSADEPPGKGQAAREPRARELGSAREADRRERDRVPAPGHPPEDRRAGQLLPRLQGRGDPARDSRRGHHHLREALHLHPDGEPARPGPAPDPGGARRAARARRPAPAARAARADPGGREPRHRGAGGALRPARRAPDRGAVRHHQRQAHAAQPVAHREPGRAQALPGSQPGDGARRDPLAQRGRDLAARGRDQDARHRARARLAGPARRGDRGLPGGGGEDRRRGPHERGAPARQALLPELHQGGGGRRSPPRGRGGSTRSRPAPRCAPSSASRPT